MQVQFLYLVLDVKTAVLKFLRIISERLIQTELSSFRFRMLRMSRKKQKSLWMSLWLMLLHLSVKRLMPRNLSLVWSVVVLMDYQVSQLTQQLVFSQICLYLRVVQLSLQKFQRCLVLKQFLWTDVLIKNFSRRQFTLSMTLRNTSLRMVRRFTRIRLQEIRMAVSQLLRTSL